MMDKIIIEHTYKYTFMKQSLEWTSLWIIEWRPDRLYSAWNNFHYMPNSRSTISPIGMETMSCYFSLSLIKFLNLQLTCPLYIFPIMCWMYSVLRSCHWISYTQAYNLPVSPSGQAIGHLFLVARNNDRNSYDLQWPWYLLLFLIENQGKIDTELWFMAREQFFSKSSLLPVDIFFPKSCAFLPQITTKRSKLKINVTQNVKIVRTYQEQVCLIDLMNSIKKPEIGKWVSIFLLLLGQKQR